MATGSRSGRIITLVALAFLAAALTFLPTSSAQEAEKNHLIGYIAAGLFALLAIFSLALEARAPFIRANRWADRQVKTALKSGRAMPIPPLPRNLSKIQRERQPQVESYVRQLIAVPWGNQVTVSDSEAQRLFYQTLTFVRRVTGDWSKFREPIQVFASMPAPWCYIGAAELMYPLSYLVGNIFSPVGLQQGLRFIAQAQAVDPDNADALLTRARLLACVSDPRWLQLAQETLARAQAIAPNHQRLPGIEATLFQRYGQYEKALACYEQAIARAQSPESRTIARVSYANLLMDMKRYEEAVSAYRTLLETEANDPWLWHNLSIALYSLQRYQEALACNERALSVMPFNAALVRGEMIRKKLAERASGGFA